MGEHRFSLRKGMLLVAFGVGLYSLLQNLGPLKDGWLYFWGIISPVILGLCMAFVLNVMMVACERWLYALTAGCGRTCAYVRTHARNSAPMPKPTRSRKPTSHKRLYRGIALLLTLLLAFGLITLMMVVIIPKVSEAIGMFIAELPQSSKELAELLGDFLTKLGIDPEAIANMQSSINQISEQVLAWVKNEGSTIAAVALNMTSSLLGTITDIIFGLIIAIYVLLDKERIGRFVYAVMTRFLPRHICVHIAELAKLSYTTFSAFVRGQFLEAVILGALCFVGMLIFRFPYAPVISLLIGVTALIPIIGAWIGGIISALLVLLVSPIKAVLLIVFIILLQQLEGDLIYPKVVGASIGLPGVLVLTAVIIGQGLMGIFGILLSVPLTAVLFTVLKQAVYGSGARGPLRPQQDESSSQET